MPPTGPPSTESDVEVMNAASSLARGEQPDVEGAKPRRCRCLTNHEHHGLHRADADPSTHGNAQRHFVFAFFDSYEWAMENWSAGVPGQAHHRNTPGSLGGAPLSADEPSACRGGV